MSTEAPPRGPRTESLRRPWIIGGLLAVFFLVIAGVLIAKLWQSPSETPAHTLGTRAPSTEPDGTLSMMGVVRAVAVDDEGRTLYVTRMEQSGTGGTVVVLDMDTHQISDYIEVGEDPFDVALDQTTQTLYVANRWSDSVSVIDTSTNDVVATIDVGEHPFGIAVDSMARIVYVSNGMGPLDGTISVIDTTTNEVIETIPVGKTPRHVAFHPEARTAYVGHWSGDSETDAYQVSVIDTATHEIISAIEVGDRPNGVAVDPGMNMVYVSHWGEDADTSTVSVIDTTTNEITETITIEGIQALHIALDPEAHAMYVSYRDSGQAAVAVIDTVTNEVTSTVILGSGPADIAVDSSTGDVYVGNSDSREVRVLRAP